MSGFVLSLGDPPANFAAVTPSDTTDFGSTPKTSLTTALYVGGAGAVVAVTEDGTAVTFAAVPAGTTLRIRCRRVNSTNTTATNIVRLW